MRSAAAICVAVLCFSPHDTHAQILSGRLAPFEVDFVKMVSDLANGSKVSYVNDGNVGRWFGLSAGVYYLSIREGSKAGKALGAGLQARYIFNNSVHLLPEFVYSPFYIHKKFHLRLSLGPSVNFIAYRRLTGISGTIIRKAEYDTIHRTSIGAAVGFYMKTYKSRIGIPLDYSVVYSYIPTDSHYKSDDHVFMMSFGVGFDLYDGAE
jgi:hypothetical protein